MNDLHKFNKYACCKGPAMMLLSNRKGGAARDAIAGKRGKDDTGDVNRLIADQLQGVGVSKLSIDTSNHQSKIRFDFHGGLWLTTPSSITANGCPITVEQLQSIVYESVRLPPTDINYSNMYESPACGGWIDMYESPARLACGGWIHGDDCNATILTCETYIPVITPAHHHVTTGGISARQGMRQRRGGEQGPCTLTFEWKSKSPKPPVTIAISTSYAKFMWDPFNPHWL
jgi:hypothetical protein